MWIEDAFKQCSRARDAMQLLDMMVDHLKVYLTRTVSHVACGELVKRLSQKHTHVLFSWEIRVDTFHDAWLIGYDSEQKQWSVVVWDSGPKLKVLGASQVLEFALSYLRYIAIRDETTLRQVYLWAPTKKIPNGLNWEKHSDLVEQATLWLNKNSFVSLTKEIRAKL